MSAISSGRTIRPRGLNSALSDISFSVIPYLGWAVSVNQGATAFTRIFLFANSNAAERVKPTIPDLLEQ